MPATQSAVVLELAVSKVMTHNCMCLLMLHYCMQLHRLRGALADGELIDHIVEYSSEAIKKLLMAPDEQGSSSADRRKRQNLGHR